MNLAGADDLQNHVWDAVIIGTGAGGATAGLSLARAGRSVIFLERGKVLDRDHAVVRGKPFSWNGNVADALGHGWWPDALSYRNGAQSAPANLPIGCGTGGSTAVFGMVMDRFRPQDFTPRQFHAPTPDVSLPDAWPITYEELEPFYEEAERLFRVRGTPDPLGPARSSLLQPLPPSPKELAISSALMQAGLHPYRLHYAQDRKPDCSGCPGMLCPRECRNDAGRMCLRPALDEHGAQLLSECRVVRLEESQRSVTRAVCEWNGRQIEIRGKIFVLAANAFLTPAVLERSANDRFPTGLANSSGLVGRNLMLHVSDFLLLRLRKSSFALDAGMNHGLSINDFYLQKGVKLGNIHAHPVEVARETIAAFLRLHMKWLNRLPDAGLSAVAAIGSYLHRTSTVFATILEDLPYAWNRVSAVPGPGDRVQFEYTYPDELRRRSWLMFDAFTRAVGGHFDVRMLKPLGTLNCGHVCGTCRFGDDPATSVLDRDNRAHDLDNLYVLDASFFPSSGGTNPSLTIVANSLRVSRTIAARL